MIKTTIVIKVEGDGLSAEVPYELRTHEHIFDESEVGQHAEKVLASLDVVETIRSLAAEAVEAASGTPEKRLPPEDEETPESAANAAIVAAAEAAARRGQEEANG